MTDDPLLQLMSRLPPVEPDAVRMERVRARCRAVLAHGRREQGQTAAASNLWPLVACLGCAYGTEMIRQALLLYGIL